MVIADRDLFDGYLMAWNAHDSEAVARYMADDAIYEDVALGRVLHGPSEIAAFVDEATRASSDFRFEEVSLFTAGRDYANEWVPYTEEERTRSWRRSIGRTVQQWKASPARSAALGYSRARAHPQPSFSRISKTV